VFTEIIPSNTSSGSGLFLVCSYFLLQWCWTVAIV